MNEHQCPQNKSEWDTASQKLQCVDPNSYHCLRTEDGGETEQCLGKVWIQEACISPRPISSLMLILESRADTGCDMQKGMCPEYNSKVGKIDVFSCSHMPGCPTKIYWSNDVYQYHICSDKTSSATTTARSSDHTESSEEQSLPLDIIIPVVATVLALMVLVLGFIYIYIKRRKGQNNKKDKQRKEENNLTTFEAEDAQRGHLLLKDNNDEQSDSPCIKNEHSVEIYLSYSPKVEKLRQYTASKDDIHRSDVRDLKDYGILIFTSSDKGKIGQRMMALADCGEFGQSRYEHSLNLWEPLSDVDLYLFRQPLDDSSLKVENIKDMHNRVTKTPRTYFVLYFDDKEWRKYKNQFSGFELFKYAKIKEDD